MNFTVFTSGFVGNRNNVLYPNQVEIATAQEMDAAIKFDHVCAQYKDNKRSSDNFLSSDVLVMDCDNDESEVLTDWISADKLNDLMPDISYVIVFSRNNNKVKDGKCARPRFHVYFPISKMNSATEYVALKKQIHRMFPFFDSNALDAGRFIFGSDSGKCIWHEGWLNIDEAPINVDEKGEVTYSIITQGKRNNTLSRFASRVLKRFGNTDKAFELFLNEANKCDPPLEDAELNTIWQSALKFFENKVCKQEGYISPQQYNNDFIAESLKPEDYSDIGQAKVIVREYRDELKYTDGTDYIRFDGEKWNESKQQAVGAAEEFLDLQLQDAEDEKQCALEAVVSLGLDKDETIGGGKKFISKLDDKQLKAFYRYQSACNYFAFVMQRRNMKYIVSALQAAKPMLEISMADLDKDAFLLNTPGATIDLREGLSSARQPQAEDLITRQTAVAPSNTGEELWHDALQLIFSNDAELIEYVQQIVGLAAIGKVYVEALIIAYGEGSNGKSTFWNTISKVMGSYSGAMSADALTVGCKRNVKPEMAELKGKRLVIAAELEEGMRLNTSVIKQLCSTDEIQAEKKFKDPFKFTPSHTLVLYTNHLPKVGARDSGTWRRLIVIPFNAKISGSSDIKNYSDYLYRNAGPAIMKWIIEGAEKVISKDYMLDYPQCVTDAIAAYKEDNNWLGNFFDECCELGDFKQKSGELYTEYRAYCARNGEYARSTTDFYTALENSGLSKRKMSNGVFISGVKLKDEFLN